MILAAIILAAVFLPRFSYFPSTTHGPILHEEVSEYSKIRVRGKDSRRHLLFVSESGKEQLQSSIDLDNPGILQVAYTRTLFASLLFRSPQNRMLIIGLGGGGMIRFADHHFPETTQIEAVEIDPAVVRIAAEYFGTRQSARVTIHTEDAFVFLKQQQASLYDAIYMDAFLRPSVDSETDSKTARLKTVAFLETISNQLVEDGVLACNLIAYRKSTRGDIEALREVFPTVKTIAVAGTANLAVIAGKKKLELSENQWIAIAKDLEKSIALPFSDYARKMK